MFIDRIECASTRHGLVMMDSLAKQLDTKLHEWAPETADQMRQVIAELIDLADRGVLDIMRSRSVEQDVMDLLDEPKAR